MMRDDRDYRVLVCTDAQDDAAHLQTLLAAEGLVVDPSTSWTGLTEEQAATFAMVLFGRGSIRDPPDQDFFAGLQSHDQNRAIPVVLLRSSSDTKGLASPVVENFLRMHPYATVLDWPAEDYLVIRAAKTALQIRRLQSADRELEEQFRILTQRAPVAFGIVQGTRFVFANHFFAEWSGYTADELLKMDFPALVHPQFRQMMLDRAKRRQSGEAVPDHYEFLAVTKNGEERWFDFSPALIEYQGKPAVIGAGLDITTRKRAEQALQRSEASLRLLSQTARKLMLAANPDEVLGGIFEDVSIHLGAEIFINYLVVPDRTRLRLHSWRGLDESALKAMEYVQFGQPLCGTVARDRTRVVMPHVRESTAPGTEALRTLGIRAYACHALQDHEVVGTISFCSLTRDEFSDEDLEVMRAVADQASMALARQRLTATLEQRAAALDEANQAKDKFLAVLSHELRTPLTPVLAVISMLRRRGNLELQLQQDLEMIRRNIELEARLIDDLLDLNRIERGKVELHKQLVDMCTILQQAVEVCRPELEERQLHFTTHFGDVAKPVEADPGRLQQVFWNLIKNAIKFTPPNGCVGVRCRSDDGHVVIEVSDSGVGIEPEMLPKIFDAFAQADRNITREFGGLGLGLAISKSLVELHGGTIEAQSEGGNRGSTFVVRLPLRSNQQPAGMVELKPPQAQVAPGPHRLRILLAEDHRDTAQMISRVLQSEGHEVAIAGDVATALQKATDEGYDLLVSDLGLPDGSGLDLMREVRGRGLPLRGIALSGYGQEQDLQKSREAGFRDHLIKPVDIDRLIAAIDDAAQSPLPVSL